VTNELTERDKKLIRYLMDNEHTSPFEHNQLSFRVKCPLYVAKQWMRHRMNSYNEISYRYVKSACEFYIPKNWRGQHPVNRQASQGFFQNPDLEESYRRSLEVSFKTYELLLEQGVCREQARGLLPACTYTEFIYTSNLHSLVHFLKLRLDSGAQYEIQRYALGLLKLTEPHFPVALAAFREKYRIDI
ncbi:MAG TPA: FAD-dependent thymidylate synthase, partial [Candidatus Babeliaceae bacterium]|nr:FAD-dependent thymidylate synthase [Candidatus Babeliaceae bacterium]